jgi:5-methylcytosine-specific restriction endonuclease McrA
METPKYTKEKIPKALREQVWLRDMGKKYESKCKVRWCHNRITVFDFQCGHNVPESKGGSTNLSNLVAICSRCNLSMGSQYTIDDWNTMGPSWKSSRWFSCVRSQV